MALRPAVAVSAHPLSRPYATRLEEALGVRPEYVVLSHLRREPPAVVARTIAGLRGGTCFLPLEDPASAVLLPLLEAVAAAFWPRSIEIVDQDLRRRRVSRLAAVPSLAAVGAATIDGFAALRRARADLDRLLQLPRVHARRSGDRVLYLNGNLWFGVKTGGSVAHTAGVIGGFAENGFAVDVVAAAAPSAPIGEFHPLRVPRAFGVPPEVNTYRIQRSLADDIHALAARRASAILYQRLSLATYAGADAARSLRLPYVVEYNGSEAWVQQHWGRGLRFPALAEDAERATLRHAHLVVTVSDVLRDDLLARGVEPERIVSYPNCVDASTFDPARFDTETVHAVRAAHGIPQDAVVVTFVGTFGQWHGVDVLARAIRALADGDPGWLRQERVHFMLIGDGLRMPEVRAALGGNSEHWTLTGLVPQDEAPALLAASDILVSPHVRNPDGTRFFGSPTKLFEYMAMERPIVASRLDQIADVLSPALDAGALPESDDPAGDTVAVLAEPGDIEQLIKGLRFLVTHPRWREALAGRARARVVERYTWNDHVAAILAGLEHVGSQVRA